MNKFRSILFSICLITLSCQKKPFDERSKFIGDYNFLIEKVNWNINGYRKDTLYTYNGKIEHGEDSNKISIFFSEHLVAKPNLYGDWSILGNGVRGEFSTKEAIAFSISYGGIGGGTIYNVTGEKKK